MYTLIKLVEVNTLIPEVKRIISEVLGASFVDSEYEADQKLAQLAMEGSVDLVMTEDSDLIVYGCPNILYKYKSGKGMLYDRALIFEGVENNKDLDGKDGGNRHFENWELFQRFCILCGCDYYKQDGIALQKARKICKNLKSYRLWQIKQLDEDISKFDKALEMFTLFNKYIE
jgi:5'-3' exonuclease